MGHQFRSLRSIWKGCQDLQKRRYSQPSATQTSPFSPRHLLSIADLTPGELSTLVRNAASHKQTIKSGTISQSLQGSLARKTVALVFNKRSTRTRVSTEAAVTTMGGHTMFLGKDDIQLGVNETAYDTAVVISSMVSTIVARVGAHAEVLELAKHSTVPVISALSETSHPLQALADFLTLYEVFHSSVRPGKPMTAGLGLEGLNIAWVGDANNVLFDLAIAAAKLGVNIKVATPQGYEMPPYIVSLVRDAAREANAGSQLVTTNVPEEAVKDADVLVTDTWVSMGQEADAAQRLKAFAGFQITPELAKRGGAKEGWRFMHCLPRHPEEVSEEVFYGPRSVVFQEAENRLWAAISTLEAFVVNKGKIN